MSIRKILSYITYHWSIFLVLTGFISMSYGENLNIINGKILPANSPEIVNKLKDADSNLVLGKEVQVSYQPSQYGVSSENMGEKVLTDGNFSIDTGHEKKLWFHKGTAVWREITKLFFYIDLKAENNVGSIVIHTDGGGVNDRFTKRAPGKIRIYGGVDKEKYQLLGIFDKEKALKNFWMPEENGTYWTGWVSFGEINVKARYLLVEIDAIGSSVAFDEIAVFKASESKINSISKTDYNYRFCQDFCIYAGKDKSIIPVGAYCYERFGMICNFKEETEVKLKVETPQWLDIGWFVIGDRSYDIAGKSLKKDAEKMKAVTQDGKKIYEFLFKPFPTSGKKLSSYKVFITIYWKADLENKGKRVADELVLKSSWNNGHSEWKQPIETSIIPEINDSNPVFQKRYLSQSRLYPNIIEAWPDFIESYRKFGFNTAVLRNPTQEHIELLKNNKIKIMLWLTEWYRMGKAIDCLTGDKKALGKSFGKNCPSYRGEIYGQGIRRIVKSIEQAKPELVFFDFEWWGFDGPECEYCERCRTYKEKSGISDWDKFKIAMGSEIWSDIYSAVKQSSQEHNYQMPEFGIYEVDGDSPYQKVWDFKELHKSGLTYAMPSCYIAIDSPCAIRQLKSYLTEMIKREGASNIIPWLCPGDHGEYPSANLEEILLWGLKEGLSGYFFWSERNWAGDDFIAFATALNKYLKQN